jgi:hypothetical protein
MKRLLLAMLLVAAPAHADVKPEDTARAAQLFEQGQAAITANKIDAACVMFDTSLRLDPQIGTRLNLADCRERQGRLVEAYALFVESGDEAARTNKPGRATFARDRAAALQMKLVRVTLRVAAPDTAGLAIKLSGRELPRREWTKPQILVPGSIVVDASAAGRDPVHVETTANAGAELEIPVPALVANEVVVDKSPPQTSPRAERSKLPWIVGGAGVALIGTSLGIGLHTKMRYDTAYKAGDKAGVDGAIRESYIATGIGIAGGVALAVGIVLYVRDRPRDSVAIVPGPGLGLAVQLTTP